MTKKVASRTNERRRRLGAVQIPRAIVFGHPYLSFMIKQCLDPGSEMERVGFRCGMQVTFRTCAL